MCDCRCGISVHLRDGKVRYIEGNRDHPVNQGVLCANGAAGIKQHDAPTRLTKPLKRVGPRGQSEFEEIEWDEALSIAATWLGKVRAKDPKQLAVLTGRDQCHDFISWWAAQFGTPNHTSHSGFPKLNTAAGGHYTIGAPSIDGGEPDWEKTRYLLMFGCAEEHQSVPIKQGLAKLRENGARFVSISPARASYASIADEWHGIRPGTDGLLIFSIIHELLNAGKIDLDYLIRFTNLPWLVITNKGAGNGLFVRNADGKPIVWDRESNKPRLFDDRDAKPTLKGQVKLASGRTALPAFQLLAERYLAPTYAPDVVAEQTGIPAATIRRLAAELAEVAFEQEIVLRQPWTDSFGRLHDKMIGRPVALYATRGLGAHANGFHTIRALHILQALLGAIDRPGGYRYKPPYPIAQTADAAPVGKPSDTATGHPLAGPSSGFAAGPEDLLVDPHGKPGRLDMALSWEAPLATQGMTHRVISNAYRRDPYPVDTLLIHAANLMVTSAQSVQATADMLTERDRASGEYRIPRIICADSHRSDITAYADLILPDTTFLEQWDGLSVQDRPIGSADHCADSIRQPVVEPDRDVRPFQDVLLQLGQHLKLPDMVLENGRPRFPSGYQDFLIHHQRQPWVGPLMGWRGVDGAKAGKGAANNEQLRRYVDNGCFWSEDLPANARYFKQANKAYLDYRVKRGFAYNADPFTLPLYNETLQKFRLAAAGHGEVQPPQDQCERIKAFFDPLPFWYPPFEDITNDDEKYPLYAITLDPSVLRSHGPLTTAKWPEPLRNGDHLYMSRASGAEFGLQDRDWVWMISRHDRVKGQIRLVDGVHEKTVWSWRELEKPRQKPDHDDSLKENQAGADSDQRRYASADPITGQVAWHEQRVRIEPASAEVGWATAPTLKEQPTPAAKKPKAKSEATKARKPREEAPVPEEITAAPAPESKPAPAENDRPAASKADEPATPNTRKARTRKPKRASLPAAPPPSEESSLADDDWAPVSISEPRPQPARRTKGQAPTQESVGEPAMRSTIQSRRRRAR